MSSAQTAHRQSLAGVRRALGFTLVGRDRDAGVLCRRQDLTIPAETPLRARLYIPEGAEPASPGLVFFHGGGFVFCDIESHDAFCARLAAAGRFRLLSIDYRLAPEARFPAQLEDAIAALTWARVNAADLGVDPDRLGAGGDSAGGYLAIAASARVNADRPGSVSALSLIYPLLQMDDEVWASSLFRHSRLLGRLAVRYIRAQLAGADPAPSLVGNIDGALPSVIVHGGHLDPVAPDDTRHVAALRAAGVTVEHRVWPALPHGFGNLTHLSLAARRAVAETGRLTGELLRRG